MITLSRKQNKPDNNNKRGQYKEKKIKPIMAALTLFLAVMGSGDEK